MACKVCKEPPICVATCDAKTYYVSGKCNMTHVCIHLGSHDHPTKVGEYKGMKEKINSLIEEHINRIPSSTKSAIVLKANKDVLEKYLL